MRYYYVSIVPRSVISQDICINKTYRTVFSDYIQTLALDNIPTCEVKQMWYHIYQADFCLKHFKLVLILEGLTDRLECRSPQNIFTVPRSNQGNLIEPNSSEIFTIVNQAHYGKWPSLPPSLMTLPFKKKKKSGFPNRCSNLGSKLSLVNIWYVLVPSKPIKSKIKQISRSKLHTYPG